MNYWNNIRLGLITGLLFPACQSYHSLTSHDMTRIVSAGRIDSSEQLVVVTTPSWTSTTGTMRRFERSTTTSEWRSLDAPIPVVVGRTGIAWGVGFDEISSDGPHKHEGDGKAPAGVFPLDTAFGFAPLDSMRDVKLPYVQLLPTN